MKRYEAHDKDMLETGYSAKEQTHNTTGTLAPGTGQDKCDYSKGPIDRKHSRYMGLKDRTGVTMVRVL